MNEPTVAFVILNWNQTELTLACLHSLAALDYGAHTTILVDNCSEPGSLAAIEAEFPEVTLIRNDRNLGFTGGNNVGIRRAVALGVDYIMLLNNDTEVASDMLTQLVAVAESDAGIGVVGPVIYYFDHPDVIWSAGGRADDSTGLAWSLGDGETDSGSVDPRRVDYVSGCGLMIRRSVVEEIGPLDERLFIYHEETDWCARVREAGYTIWLAPAARMWHKIRMEARVLSKRYIYLMTRNRLLYLEKRGVGRRELLANTLNYDLRTIVSWNLYTRHREQRKMSKYRALGALDYWRGRFGEPPFSN